MVLQARELINERRTKELINLKKISTQLLKNLSTSTLYDINSTDIWLTKTQAI